MNFILLATVRRTIRIAIWQWGRLYRPLKPVLDSTFMYIFVPTDPEEWFSTLVLLQKIFLKASEACLQKGMIDTETYMEFKPIGNKHIMHNDLHILLQNF